MALIPADAGLRMRLDNELQPQQIAPVKGLPADLPRLQAGQIFTAQIRDVLPQNTYLALVAGKQVTLSLPENVKSGDVLELIVIEQTPSTVVAKRAEPGSTSQLSPQTTLSNTAQMLRSLLPREGETPTAAPLNRGQPLLSQPPQNGAELAPALSKAVAQSGLFYESHQAQWIAGKLPLANLKQEPQGQQAAPQPALPAPHQQQGILQGQQPVPTASPATTAGTAITTQPGTLPLPQAAAAQTPPQAATPLQPPPQPATPLPPGLLLYQSNQSQAVDTPLPPASPGSTAAPQTTPQATLANSPAAAANAAQSPAAASAPKETFSDATLLRVYTSTAGQGAAPIPEELRTLVQQQLDAAGTQRLLWHGEVWPEQAMHWQLEWQQQGHQGGDTGENLPWQTRLRLTTPRLGSIEANLQLGAAGVRITLNADDASSTAEMRDKTAELAQSLEAAGLTLLGLTVRQTPEAEP